MASFSGTTPTDTVELQELIALDTAVTNTFGHRVAMSSDGSIALVGDYSNDTLGGNSGAVYVYTRSGSTWIQQQKLASSDILASDFFGYSVAISSDGSTIIVGAYGEDTTPNSGNGAAYVFTLSGGIWVEQQKLLASDAAGSDFFGRSVALSQDGNTALIGAESEDTTPNTNNGAAYVFTRSSGVWTQQQKLTASDAATNDYFGMSVSLSGDGNTALIGAYGEDTTPSTDNGAAYVFTRSAGTWTQLQKLLASDYASSARFGISVALSSDGLTAIVGSSAASTTASSSGAAYIFKKSTVFNQEAKLAASDAATDDFFGEYVSISSDGNIAIIGAYFASTEQYGNNGASYLFTRSGTTWTQQQKLTASDKNSSSYFGRSVALSQDGNTALIGADGGGVGGTAYVYALGRPLDNNLYSYNSTTGSWYVSARPETSSPSFHVFGSSVTWKVPVGAVAIEATCIGAGGGGGGGARNSSGPASGGGGGGGGGGISRYLFRAEDLGGAGASVTITVGAGGPGGAITTSGTTALDGNNGTAGGSTSFGSYLLASGGNGGTGGKGANSIAVGGLGGSIAIYSGNRGVASASTSNSSIYPGAGGGGCGLGGTSTFATGGVSSASNLTAATSGSGPSDSGYTWGGGGGAGGASGVSGGTSGGSGGGMGGGGGGGGEGSTAGAGGYGGLGGSGWTGLVRIIVWYG